jgi:hypothetical protein
MARKDKIELHKEKGLNPHMTVCQQCGQDIGLMLLGSADSLLTCNDCGKTTVGKRKARTCADPECKGRLTFKEELADTSRFPGGLCDVCKLERDTHAKFVSEGGVYFKCDDCNATGVIKSNSFTQEVREKHNIPAPNPVGVQFTKADCPACGPDRILPGKSEILQ